MDISDRRDLTIDERWHPPHLGQSATFPCVPVSCVPVVHQDRKGRENDTLEIAFDRIASARWWKAHTAVAQFVPDRRWYRRFAPVLAQFAQYLQRRIRPQGARKLCSCRANTALVRPAPSELHATARRRVSYVSEHYVWVDLECL